MTKLTDKEIRFICRHSVDVDDWTIRQLANHYGVSIRRIEQLVKEYRETKEFPKLNPSRRPKGPPLTAEEKEIIELAWLDKRVGARMLYYEIKKRGHRIPHHKINAYLKQRNWTKSNPRKQKKRKRCRYEREHSFSLIHGDWHRTSIEHPHTIVWLDDASRYALAGAEFKTSSMAYSIETFDVAVKEASSYYAKVREVNTDRGAEFYSNHPNSISKFQKHLIDEGIIHIPSGRSNPQTNGKLERFWFEYDKHRWRFENIDEFLGWYNDRLHGGLWLEIGETPNEAVLRKLQPECILGAFWRRFE